MDTVSAPAWLALTLAAAWLLVRLAEVGIDMWRTHRGLPTGDHCEHCTAIEELRDQHADVASLRDELTAACTAARPQALFAASACSHLRGRRGSRNLSARPSRALPSLRGPRRPCWPPAPKR